MPEPANLYRALPGKHAGEVFETLAESSQIRIERIVSNGQATPAGEWYDQDRDEWVTLLRGSASLEYADGHRISLKEGDHLTIPAHEKHRVAETSSDALWLAVHFA